MRARLNRCLKARGLTLNEKKPRIVNFREEGLSFLSFDLSWRKGSRTGRGYVHVEPGAKARQSLHDAIREELNHWTLWRSVNQAVARVNRIQRGWSGYFHYRNSSRIFGKERRWMCDRTRRWWWRKGACRRSLWEDYPEQKLQDFYGLWPLPATAGWTQATRRS